MNLPATSIRRPAAVLAAAAALILAACGPEPAGDAPTRTVTVDIGPSAPQTGDRGAQPEAAPADEPPPEVPGDADCPGARDATTAENLRRAEIAIRCLTNAVRREKDLDELRFDERLARAAATRSNDMAEADYFGHEGPGNSNVRTAVRGTGWIPERKSWLLGENIGWASAGRASPADLMRSWLDSPTHRRNILSEHFTEIGVGAVAAVPKAGAEPGATFTQIFGVTGSRARRAQGG